MSSQSVWQSQKQRKAPFSEHGKIATEATQVHRPWLTAKTAGNLLLHFHHVDVALGQRAIQGHIQVVHKDQYGVFVLRRMIEQVARRTLFASFAPLWIVLK